ncbi:MAG TPA: FUSC family protein [Streptosporangiaceae bacterium]|nr:FUSC family protein [Streptosporangiaceae bacterium]
MGRSALIYVSRQMGVWGDGSQGAVLARAAAPAAMAGAVAVGRVLTGTRKAISSGGPTVADWLIDAVPEWLAAAARPQRSPVPWPDMVRAILAIGLPLVAGLELGEKEPGLLVALGGLLGVAVDNGGAIRARTLRVGSAACGGALGLVLGSVLHGHGWVAVIALAAIAGVSALLSSTGGIGSVTALQLLVYTSVSMGPLGAVRPWWHIAVGFVLGAAWAMLLTMLGWLVSRRAAERRCVAAVYRALAAELRAIGTPGVAEARQQLDKAFNVASDTLLTRRSTGAGRMPRLIRLMALLNQANLIGEAATALSIEGTRPPPDVSAKLDALADTIQSGAPKPTMPKLTTSTPGMNALRDELEGVARVLSGKLVYRGELLEPRPPLRQRLSAAIARLTSKSSLIFAVRLMACVGVAGVMTEVLPLSRSYWVILTVVIVLKPDLGSVFVRAVQRGIGTVIGAVLGAAILAVVPFGPWLLLPFAILAALLPYGRSRNYGLFAVFLTPLVVLLIDLLAPAGWYLALDRLVDTLLGCAVVLLVGYAPWPSSWHADLPRHFAAAVYDVCWYVEAGLCDAAQAGRRAGRADVSMARRRAYRALSDLRGEFDRCMSEPAAASRQATAWWPALVGLEGVVDAVTAVAVAVRQGEPAADPGAVHELTAALDATADAVKAGLPPRPAELPSDPSLKPVTDAVRAVLAILARAPKVHRPALAYQA